MVSIRTWGERRVRASTRGTLHQLLGNLVCLLPFPLNLLTARMSESHLAAYWQIVSPERVIGALTLSRMLSRS